MRDVANASLGFIDTLKVSLRDRQYELAEAAAVGAVDTTTKPMTGSRRLPTGDAREGAENLFFVSAMIVQSYAIFHGSKSLRLAVHKRHVCMGALYGALRLMKVVFAIAAVISIISMISMIDEQTRATRIQVLIPEQFEITA